MKISSTELRKQTTLARRTVTSIQNLVSTLTYHGKFEPQLGELSSKDKLQLDKAMEVISKISGKYALASKKTKAKEVSDGALYEQALRDAKKLLTSWDTSKSLEAKLTIIIANLGHAGTKREIEDPANTAKDLERMYATSLEQFATYAAYKVTESKSITLVLDDAYTIFKMNVISPEIISLAQLWKAKL